MITLAAAFLVAMAATWILTPWAARLALRCGAVAVPRDRDVHEETKPRWGGIAIYLGVLIAASLAITYRHYFSGGPGWTRPVIGLLTAGTFIGLVGMLDDLHELNAAWQIVAMLVAGLILVAFGIQIEGIANPLMMAHENMNDPRRWIALAPAAGVALTLFWTFLVTKTLDAMDGLDGLAAGVCAISSGTLALLAIESKQPGGATIALLAAAITGACVGFLRHNYNPARIFMSTVGAQFLGLMLAGLSIMGTFKVAAAISVLLPVLVFGVPILDYAVVLVKRFRHGAPLMSADRRHLHHRLLDSGLSHRQAVWVIYGCTATLCAAAVLLFRVSR